jgi:hypothetical protein
MAVRTLRCPQCGGIRPEVEFTLMQEVKSYRHLIVTGPDNGDGLQVEGLDHTYGDPVGPLLMQCGGCGHEWPTTRAVAWASRVYGL